MVSNISLNRYYKHSHIIGSYIQGVFETLLLR